MIRNNQDMVYEDPSKLFIGVHFLLVGFDSITQAKIRSKIVDGGGVDVVRYCPDCTHVIVDKVVYDDPICVAARSDGKTLVTGLWIEDSFDVGMPVDPSSIMYRPLRDLNGILDANSLIVCLTGYQRQHRDDIMTMVGLMGANFSKPLVASKVTHLICYKFEGEKYELAKKIKKIKLVNHQWLEDCLRAWQILPEADYEKSGYELEMMEAHAKDSEDEAQDMTTISKSLSASRKEANPDEEPFQSGTPSRCLEVPGSTDTGNAGRICNGMSIHFLDKTPLPENVGSDLTKAPNSDRKSPHSSASKFNALSYYRKTPRKASLPLETVQAESNNGSSPVADSGKLHITDCFNLSSPKMEEDETISDGFKSPLKETLTRQEDEQSNVLPDKRKMAISCGSSKIKRTHHNLDFISGGALSVNRTEESAPEPFINDLLGITAHSPGNNSLYADNSADLNPLRNSPANILNTSTPEIMQECSDRIPQMSSEKTKSNNLDSRLEVTDAYSTRPESAVNDSKKPQNGLQDEVPPSAAKVTEVAKSSTTVELDFSEGGEASSRSKPLRRKLLAKKTLGSRPSFGRGKALNQKGIIHMNKNVSENNSATGSLKGNETESHERFVSSERIKLVPPNSGAETNKDIEMVNVLESGNVGTKATGFVDDETEAPGIEEENDLNAMVDKKKSGDTDVPQSIKQTDDNFLGMEVQVIISGEVTSMIEDENAPSATKMEQSEPTFMDTVEEEKIVNNKKRPSTKTKKKNLPTVAKLANSTEGDRRKVAKNEVSNEKTKPKNEKCSHILEDGDMTASPLNMGKNSTAMEKENLPVHIGSLNTDNSKQQVKKLTQRSNTKSLKKEGGDPGPESVGRILKMKIETIWFMLSGHKLQRKDFQQVIRRLKGKVCRDSHQWSYQATHFIVPDPIRRTEKFFAAAASGRWILKTDYLTASNEAGRFLAEEPYEWNKKGLSEDGAINLEAPRKWRLLRERTGHGSFYGMRIIIYGECIAPPLDTLKRVVKAGDGTILATSPPYTRVLKSGVDFAIVSPGMPRVDIWVQEFLRHEIPCVLADYLVEYVCKPGYSLDRHVQYSTLAWAEKSFKNLVKRMEEIIEDSTPHPDDDDDDDDNTDDITCQVCGSRDRGEVMLICGDESGSSGCGIGTHIDCCDPPLEGIPAEDWFCYKCRNRNSKNAQKSSRKSISTSKQK